MTQHTGCGIYHKGNNDYAGKCRRRAKLLAHETKVRSDISVERNEVKVVHETVSADKKLYTRGIRAEKKL